MSSSELSFCHPTRNCMDELFINGKKIKDGTSILVEWEDGTQTVHKVIEVFKTCSLPGRPSWWYEHYITKTVNGCIEHFNLRRLKIALYTALGDVDHFFAEAKRVVYDADDAKFRVGNRSIKDGDRLEVEFLDGRIVVTSVKAWTRQEGPCHAQRQIGYVELTSIIDGNEKKFPLVVDMPARHLS